MERYILVGIIALWGSSCGVLAPHIAVLRGNYAFNIGNYQEALTHYHEAEETPEFSPWIQYNLGNLYKSMGEQDAALRMWNSLEGQSQADILFGINFNRGLLYYERGQFALAYQNFLHALSIDATHIDAKINLELALEKLRASEQFPQQQDVQVREEALDAASERILTYVKRKEDIQWISRFQDQEAFIPQDW